MHKRLSTMLLFYTLWFPLCAIAQEPSHHADMLVKSAGIISEKYLVPIPKEFLFQSGLLRMKGALLNPDLAAQSGVMMFGEARVFIEQRIPGLPPRPAPDPAKVQQLLKKIDEVYTLIKQKPAATDVEYRGWLDEIFTLNATLNVASGTGLAHAALRGMVNEVDGRFEMGERPAVQWTRYARRMGTAGIHIHIEDGHPRINYVYPGSPASRADLRPGDFILRIDGKETKGLALDDVQKAIRGKPGTKVVLTVRRPDVEKPLEVELTRASSGSYSFGVRSKFVSPESKIGYVRFWQLQEGRVSDVDEAVQDLAAQGMAGLILDLRIGWIESFAIAAELVDRLVAGDWTLVYEARNGIQKEPRTPKPGTAYPDVPLVVLVDRATNGPQELIAAAVKATGRGLVLGDTTAGRAVGQQEFVIEGHSYRLRFASAVYRTPKNEEFLGKGIEPDIRVEMDGGHKGRLMARMNMEDFGQRGGHDGRRRDPDEDELHDVQLQKAIEYLGGVLPELGKKNRRQEAE